MYKQRVNDLTVDNHLIRRSKGFFHTFEKYPLHNEWLQVLHNYFVRGIHPGGFHRALLANDLTGATRKTHQLNKWQDICAFMAWVAANTPNDSWGSYKNVSEWLALTPDARRVICEQCGWLLTDQQLAWELLSETDEDDENVGYI